MPNKVRFLFGKGVIDIVLYIDKFGKAGYYEMYQQNYVVSRQAFSNILKVLEKNDIACRKVLESRPPKVEYSLTSKGKEVATLLKRINELV